jgi:hypothetical protein
MDLTFSDGKMMGGVGLMKRNQELSLVYDEFELRMSIRGANVE